MMKNFLLTVSLLFVSLISFGQLRTLNYQAVILDPKPIEIPGTNITGQPLKNGKVNVRFALLSSSGSVDYEENHETTTDEFGLINLTIGSGLVNASGIASNSNSITYRTFDSIKWDSNVKQLKVSLSFDSGKKYTNVSLQPFNYTAYAFYAESVEYKNVRDSPTTLSFFNNDVGFIVSKDLDPLKNQMDQNQKDNMSKFLIINQSLSESDKKIADNSNEIAATKSKMGDMSITVSNQGNQINEQNNRINSNQEKVTGQINNLNSQIEKTDSKVQNLENSYENSGNKSNNIQSDQASTNRYPSVKAVKDYVDQATQGVALQATVNGKEDKTSKSTDIKNDKNPTTNYPTVEAVKSYVLESALGIDTKIIIDGKENVSNKSRDVSADAGSNDKYPTVAAIKQYVDNATSGVALQATVNGKEDKTNKSNDIAKDKNPSSNYPTVEAVKSYVDKATINSLSKEVQRISINADKTIISLKGREDQDESSEVTLPTVIPAETNALGLVKLAGDLGGDGTSASAPRISTSAITTTKIADNAVNTAKIAANAVSLPKIEEIAPLSILGNKSTKEGNVGVLTLGTGLSIDLDGKLNSTGGTVTGVSGATNRIKVTTEDQKTPVVDISENYVGQNTITTVGTITTGTWSGTTVDVTKGGTGATSLATGYVKGNGTAALTTVPNIPVGDVTDAESTLNKSAVIDLGNTGASDIKFPTQKAVKTYVDNATRNALTSEVQTISINELKTVISLTGGTQTSTITLPVVPSAEATILGIVKLAGDLDGVGSSAAAPRISNLAVNADKLAANAVTTDKINNAAITSDKLDANAVTTDKIAANAVDFTKVRQVGKQTVLGRGNSDEPNGNVEALTLGTGLTIDKGILNSSGGTLTGVSGTDNRINITNTDSKAPKIDISSSYLGQTSITTVGTITSGTWSGTTVDVTKGGTGATSLTGFVRGNGTGPLTAIAKIDVSDVTNGESTGNKSETFKDVTFSDHTKYPSSKSVSELLNSKIDDERDENEGKYAKKGEGNTFSGDNTFNNRVIIIRTPTERSDAANKGYIDDEIEDKFENTLATDTKFGLIKLTNDLGGSAAMPTVNSVGGVSSSTIKTNNTLVSNATNENNPSTIVKRDGSGNFSAGTILADLTGTASKATNLSGGDAGTIVYQSSTGNTSYLAAGTTGTVLKSKGNAAPVWEQLSTSELNGTISLTTQVSGVLPSENGGTGVNNDGKKITLGGDLTTEGNITTLKGSNTGDQTIKLEGAVTGTGTGTFSTTISESAVTTEKIAADAVTSAKIANNTILNEDILDATITDAKLATITRTGKVANSATTATSANTYSSIVARDDAGNFEAGTITANLTGTASKATSLAGTVPGSIPFQTGSGTDYTTAGPFGYVLKSNGASAPIWTELKTSDLSGTYSLTNTTGILPGAKGGTGVDNGDLKITLGGNLTTGLGEASVTGSNTGDQTIVLEGAVTGTGKGTFSTTLSNDAVTTDKIAANAVTSAKIVNNTIVNDDILDATITDAKLAIIASPLKVSNTATTATSTNTAYAIVARDAAGNFAATRITSDVTGNLTGNATTATSATKLAGGDAGKIVYQSGVGITSFSDVGTAGQVLKSNGSAAPTWTTISTSDITGLVDLTSKVTGILPGANGGTGVDNGIKKITLGGNLTTAGAFETTLTSMGATNVTLPLSGTLATLAGTETLTSKTILDGDANTQNANDNSTKIATTAFVTSATPDATLDKKGLIQLTNDLGGTAIAPTVVKVGEVSSSMIATMNTSVGNATSTNTFNTIVKRDGAGNFAAGKITADLTGKVNDITISKVDKGFTISGGTESKTLTVASDASVTGTNTGDQTIDQLINTGAGNSGQYLRSNGTNAVLTAIQAGDLPISLTTNGTSGAATYSSTTGVLNIPNYNLASLNGVEKNNAITGGTKTKITYDSKGLVTSGADATTADISDEGSSRKYVTQAQIDKIAASELSANKSPDTGLGGIDANNTNFPTQKAVKVYVDTKIEIDDNRLDDHDNKLGQHETKLGVHDRDISSAKTSLSNQEGRLSTAEGNIGTFSSTIADHKRRLGEAESSIISQSGKITDAEGKINSQGNDITLTKSDLNDQKARLNTAESAIGTYSTTLADHDSRIKTLNNKFKTDIDDWDATLAVGKILIGNESNKAQARSVSGDITLDKNGVTTLKDVLNTGEELTTWGDNTLIPKITLDKKGRVIAITEAAVAGNLYQNFTLGQGKIFVGNKNNKASDVEMTGDVTIVRTSGDIEQTGETIIGEGKITSAKIANGTIVNADISEIAAISDTKLGTISSANKVSNSATSATASNTATAIVARDGSGSFSANMITANVTGNLSGNASTATSATTANNLAGTVAGSIPYQSAAGITSYLTPGASGFVLKSKGNAAPAWEQLSTSDVTGTISLTTQVAGVLPGANGGTGYDNTNKEIRLGGNLITSGGSTTFTSSGDASVTLPLSGTLSTLNGIETLTNKTIENGFATTQNAGDNTTKIATTAFVKTATPDATSGVKGLVQLTNDLGGSANAPTVNSVGGVSSSTIATINTSVGNATSTATAGEIVKRDGSNNFSAGTITANLSGNASTATLATTANSLAGGALGAIPYQSAAGSTSYLTPGTSGYVLKSKGNAAPAWEQLSTSDLTGTYSLTDATGILPGAKGGTGVINDGKTITLGGNLTTSGAFGTTLTTIGTTDVTLPLSGTLATLSGTETLTSKFISDGNANTQTTGDNSTKIATTAFVKLATPDATSGVKGLVQLTNDLGGTAIAPTVNSVGGVNSSTIATIKTDVIDNATASATAGTIVKRDGSNNFSAGTITANLSGNASTATTANSLAGGSAGAITYQSAAGTSTFTTVGTTGQVLKSNGSSAPTWTSLSLTDITTGTISLTSQVTGILPVANGGTGVSTTPSNGQIDIGNGTGFTRANLTAGNGIIITNGPGTITITSTDDDAEENKRGKIQLAGDLSGTALIPVIGNNKINSAKIENASILNEDIATTAAITDTKLATISTALKVSNSATTATASNTASAIVARDGSNNFSAGTITASLIGNVTGNLTGNVTGNLTGTATRATTATNAGNLTGTTVGSVPYQSAPGVTSYSDGGSTGDVLIRTSDGMVWATQVAETLSQVSESGNSHTFTLADTPLAGTKLIVFSSGGSKISNSKININVKSITIDTGSKDDTKDYEFYYYK